MQSVETPYWWVLWQCFKFFWAIVCIYICTALYTCCHYFSKSYLLCISLSLSLSLPPPPLASPENGSYTENVGICAGAWTQVCLIWYCSGTYCVHTLLYKYNTSKIAANFLFLYIYLHVWNV
jgi:hypothetical protein